MQMKQMTSQSVEQYSDIPTITVTHTVTQCDPQESTKVDERNLPDCQGTLITAILLPIFIILGATVTIIMIVPCWYYCCRIKADR